MAKYADKQHDYFFKVSCFVVIVMFLLLVTIALYHSVRGEQERIC